MTTRKRAALHIKRSKPAKSRVGSDRSKTTASLADQIEAAFAKLITIDLNGRPVKLTTFGVILLRLWGKEMRGDVAAGRMRLRLEAFARKRRIVAEPELVVIGGLPRLAGS